MKRKLLLTFLATAVSTFTASAASVVDLTWEYNHPVSQQTILGPNGSALEGAGTSSLGDGFAVQLGYYNGATLQNPFLGAWIPVFGKGTSNTLFSSASMGDRGTSGTTTVTDVRFSFTGTINSDSPGTTIGIPSGGQIMAIRYYNALTSNSATFFGAASNTNWKWTSPAEPNPAPPDPMFFNIRDTGTVFQAASGGSAPSVPQTNIAVVPEPSTWMLMGFGAATAIGTGIRRKMRRR